MMARAVSSFARVVALAGAVLSAACASGPSERSSFTGDPFLARKKLAFELMTRREWKGALAYIDELRGERKDQDLQVWRGIVLREQGLLEDAEAELKDVLSGERERADAHAAIGIVYDLQRRGDLAEPHHRAALQKKPDDPALLNNLGFSLFLQGKDREALPLFQKAVRMAPAQRRIRTNLGFAYGATGDFGRAAREFDRGGTAAEAKNNLGYVYERQGHWRQAFDLYVEAVRMEPGFHKARENLGYVAPKVPAAIPADLPPPPSGSAPESPVSPARDGGDAAGSIAPAPEFGTQGQH
jgi:Flp pilus assembly protein TadD